MTDREMSLRDGAPENPKSKDGSVATRLVELAGEAELWHAAGDGAPYATIRADGHAEHWPVRSRAYRTWLGRRYYTAEGRAASSQAVADALSVIEGRATYEGAEHAVYVRVAGDAPVGYLDLGDAAWRAVEVTADGWRVVTDPPMRFRRPTGMQSLPVPVAGGSLAELRELINVADDDWPLVVGWLVGCFRPRGPYPVLALHGQQGSAKSTTARMLRGLIDPAMAPLRSAPRTEQDLAIAAMNSWVLAIDNLSAIPAWLSDALCRLATGGGFAARKLYSDSDETILDFSRPAILTSITDIATRSDLLDRAVVVRLPRLAPARRRTEQELWSRYEAARPRILGALLDGVVAAIGNQASVTMAELPRMADFAVWATAAESAVGLPSGEFLRAIVRNADSANDVALEADPIGMWVMRLVDLAGGRWSGTATEMLAALARLVPDAERRRSDWPKAAHVLSGRLARIAPNLAAAGYEVETRHGGRGANKRRMVVIQRPAQSSDPSDHSDPTPTVAGVSGDAGDAGDARLRDCWDPDDWGEI